MKPSMHTFEESLRRTCAMLLGSTAATRLIAVTEVTGNPAVSMVAGLLAAAFANLGEPCISVELRERSTVSGILTRAAQFNGKTIIHCPALDESPLALEIARLVDGFVLVIEIGRQRIDLLERSIKALRLSGGVILGAIPVHDSGRGSGKTTIAQQKTAALKPSLVTELS
jgi:Mrp family chromosome partitioning ATPase